MVRLLLTVLLCVVSPSVVWAGTVHVATWGNDTTGAGSDTKPYATVQKGVDSAVEGDTVKIAGGIYDESVTLHTYRHISGSWNSDFTAQDLKSNRTIIRSASASSPAISIPSEAGTNAIDAVTLTGGSAGLQSRAVGGQDDSATVNMPLTRLIVSNNVNGLDFAAGGKAYGAKMISCLIANNSGKGYHHYGAHGTVSYALNCTFSGNGYAIYREGSFLAKMQVRNCIFENNTTALYTPKISKDARPYIPFFDRSVFYGNGVRERCADGTTSNWTLTSLLVGLLFGDPKLDADFAPQAGSSAIGRGLDSTVPRPFASTTVAAGMPVVASDVYGTPFDGTDCGCVKAAVAAPNVLSDVYVATTGSDANTGADAAHPKKSINNAIALLADGGTCHVADGTYVEAVALGVTNMTLVGESVAGTIIKSETGTDGQTKDFAVGIFAPNAVVSNLTCTASGAGVLVSTIVREVTNPKIVRTALSGNCLGVIHPMTTAVGRNDCTITLSHTSIRDSLWHGVYTFNVMRLDNVLIADSADCGIYSDTWNSAGAFYLNNVTITDSGTYGYYFNNTFSPAVYCYNSIVHANDTQGIYAAKGAFHAYKCCFYANGNDNANTGVTDETVGGVTSCLYADPLLDTTSTQRGHLAEGSPCAQSGGDYSAIAQVPSTTDLDYMKRLTDRMDMGCYISPETMEDLAGEGYHIVNVVGDPSGYGTPSPTYGRNLLEDGARRLDARGTLYTEALDGVRASQVADGAEVTEGVRAAYKGYVYTKDGASEPAYQSDTDEYLDVNLDANATMTWKWERQNRIIVSTDAPGCTVRINDGTPAACVTNWIQQGTSYTVTFIPSSDFEFDSWGGDFPETSEARTQTTTVTSDQPRALSALYRKLIRVAKSGNDDTGTGTRDQPYATIAKAISVANAGDAIYVQQGTYNETISNSSVDNLLIAGGYDANWQRDLVNAPTFIVPPSGKDCVELCGVVSNVIKGLVLTGGRYGVRSNTPGTSQTVDYLTSRYHDLSQLIITNNTGHGIQCENVKGCGIRLVSSLVAKNGGTGVAVEGAPTCGACLFNCTIVNNGGCGLFTAGGTSAYDIRNCLIAGVTAQYAYSHDRGDHQVLLAHNLFHRPSGYAAHWNEGTVITGGGNLFLEPKTNANWTLQADSPCLGAGMDLHADPRCSMLEDLYGQAWNGVYDIGCFKSSLSAPAKLANVYVATDGDDANTGADAAHPLQTPALGALRLADGGTLHFAAGTYTSGFSITAAGATVRGAGAKETVFTVGSATTDIAGHFAIDIAADNVTVERLSAVNGSGNGINLAPNTFAREILVRDCVFKGCYAGVKCLAYAYTGLMAALLPEDKGESSDTWAYHRLSRCVMSDNVTRGLDVNGVGYTAMRGDNLLVVRNGTDGVNSRDRNGSPFYVNSYFYYCTIADNAGHGVYGYDAGRPNFYNCNITGNQVGISRGKFDVPTADHCVVSGNETNFGGYFTYGDFANATNGTTTAAMTYRSSYRLARICPALGLGQWEASYKIAEPVTDIRGCKRETDADSPRQIRRDAGCYVREREGLVLTVK